MSCGAAGAVAAEKCGELPSPLYRPPATSAVYVGYVYSVNSRLGELPIDPAEFAPPDVCANAQFDFIAVEMFGGSCCATCYKARVVGMERGRRARRVIRTWTTSLAATKQQSNYL